MKEVALTKKILCCVKKKSWFIYCSKLSAFSSFQKILTEGKSGWLKEKELSFLNTRIYMSVMNVFKKTVSKEI